MLIDQQATVEDVPVTAQQKANEEAEEAPPQEEVVEDVPVTAQQAGGNEMAIEGMNSSTIYLYLEKKENA